MKKKIKTPKNLITKLQSKSVILSYKLYKKIYNYFLINTKNIDQKLKKKKFLHDSYKHMIGEYDENTMYQDVVLIDVIEPKSKQEIWNVYLITVEREHFFFWTSFKVLSISDVELLKKINN